MTESQIAKIRSIRQTAELAVIDIQTLLDNSRQRQTYLESRIRSLELKDCLSDSQEDKLSDYQDELDDIESDNDSLEELLNALTEVVDNASLISL